MIDQPGDHPPPHAELPNRRGLSGEGEAIEQRFHFRAVDF